jgi:hypothetical protein
VSFKGDAVMTSIAEQLQRSGVNPRDVQFDIAIARYLNSGGTIAGAQARLDLAAARMPGDGHSILAAQAAMPDMPFSRQPVEGVRGQRDHASSHPEAASPPSSHRDGGHSAFAFVGEGLGCDAAAREPSRQQRAASAVAANIAAITILDTLKIDGRSIGNWTIAEARRAGRLKTREGYILIEAARHVANAKGDEMIRHVIKPGDLQKIVQKAAEIADAV